MCGRWCSTAGGEAENGVDAADDDVGVLGVNGRGATFLAVLGEWVSLTSPRFVITQHLKVVVHVVHPDSFGAKAGNHSTGRMDARFRGHDKPGGNAGWQILTTIDVETALRIRCATRAGGWVASPTLGLEDLSAAWRRPNCDKQCLLELPSRVAAAWYQGGSTVPAGPIPQTEAPPGCGPRGRAPNARRPPAFGMRGFRASRCAAPAPDR